MAKSSLIRKTFPKIRLVTIKGEKFYQVDARRTGTNGKREHWKTKADAEKRAQEIADDLSKLGHEGLTFPTDLRVMALRCSELLEPFGKSLNDATQHYLTFLKEQEKLRLSRPISELTELWYEAMQGRTNWKLDVESLAELRKMKKKLNNALGSKRIAEVTKSDVTNYLNGQQIKDQTRRNITVKWGQFFNWAIEEGHTIFNPCPKGKQFANGRDIQRYDASEITEMLRICETRFPDLLPFLCICTFAGVRPGECHNLTWENIFLETHPPQVEVRKSTQAVKDFTRYVTIEENLHDWLKIFPTKTGNIIPKNHRKRLDEFKIACGFRLAGKNPNGKKWIEDGLRHTYASFWLAKHKDENALAREMGNSIDVIRAHYNRAVRPDEVNAFWQILPKSVIQARMEEKEKQKVEADEAARMAAEEASPNGRAIKDEDGSWIPVRNIIGDSECIGFDWGSSESAR